MARSETIVEEDSESDSNREDVLLWKKDCTQEQTSRDQLSAKWKFQSQGLLDKLETNKFVLGKGGRNVRDHAAGSLTIVLLYCFDISN